jgi:hypothetical protein
VNGLGIIDTDLCMWAGTVTPAMMEAAYLSVGHPVIKAKPAPVEHLSASSGGWVCAISRWVAENPIMATGVLAAGFLLFRRDEK